MLQLTNVSVNYGRLKESVRTRLIEAGASATFTWGALSDRSDAYQSACRARLSGDGLAWDSGWVEQRAQELRYEGALPEGTPIALTLQIRDDAGEESELYTNVFYNAGVEWKAGWIGAAEDEPGRTVYLRREFSIDRPVASATLYACGIGYQKLYVNGEAMDDAALDPATVDYSRTCQYVTYPDFAAHLKPGANCIGAMVGEGWRRNRLVQERLEFNEFNRVLPYAGQPAFTAMLRVTYVGGDTEWLYTDGQWQWGRGAHFSNDIFNGETCDANHASVGWSRPGFVGFAPAKTLKAPGGRMRPMILNPVIEHKRWPVLASWPVGENSVVLDFGQNLAGVLRMELPKLNKGQTIRLSHAEELNEDGTLFTEPLRSAQATDTYIASGDGRDLSVWQPIFTYHGFRYARIDGLGAGFDVRRVTAVELHTDLEIRSAFRCGDAQVTKIHELCVATERANQHHILTDCPQRDERQGWMNDATVRFEETPYNFDIGRMFPKLIRDIVDTQNADGAMTCTAPFVFGGQPADPVCSSFLVAGMQSYMHLGNKDILAEAFDAFAAWENCLLQHSDDYIVNYGYYGDWASPSYACSDDAMGDGAKSAVTPEVFMSTGYSYHNCRMLSTFAAALGRGADAKHWAEMAGKVRAALMDKWYDPAEAKLCTGSQACQVFGLWLGIIPEADAPRAARRVHDELAASDYRFTTGNLCTRYLMDVLSRYGYLEDAWTLLTKQTYPSFGFMLQQEATTVWERFELKKNPGMNSHNHPMYGAVDYWFYAYLCGIRPTKPGYEEFEVAPVFPEKLMSAQAVVDTVRGEIAVRWMKRYGKLHLHVTVPFGATAKVSFAGETHMVGSGFHVFSAPLE